MESLQSELDQIKVEIPDVQALGNTAAPEESYCSNNKKEQLLLSYAENFQRQFRQLYGDRKSLFLKPVNECGVEVGTLAFPAGLWYHSCVCEAYLPLGSFHEVPRPSEIANSNGVEN